MLSKTFGSDHTEMDAYHRRAVRQLWGDITGLIAVIEVGTPAESIALLESTSSPDVESGLSFGLPRSMRICVQMHYANLRRILANDVGRSTIETARGATAEIVAIQRNAEAWLRLYPPLIDFEDR